MLKKPKTLSQLQAEIKQLKAEKAQLRAYFREIIEIAYRAINQKGEDEETLINNELAPEEIDKWLQRNQKKGGKPWITLI